jgi:hypothetical protein
VKQPATPGFLQRPSTVTPDDSVPFRPIRRGEAAAKAAQYVADLEEEISTVTQQAAQLKNMLQLEEERNKVLTGDLKAAQLDRDYYQRRCVEIMTKLTVAGSIVLDAMKEHPEREDPVQRAAIIEAAKKAIDQKIEGDENAGQS